jgi:hypothetical protein
LAKFVATDYAITINLRTSVHRSQPQPSTLLPRSRKSPAFGSTYRSRIGGLKDASISLDFHQDFGAAAVDATLFPLIGSIATVTIKPTSGTVSASNPSYAGEFLVTQYQPFAASSAI